MYALTRQFICLPSGLPEKAASFESATALRPLLAIFRATWGWAFRKKDPDTGGSDTFHKRWAQLSIPELAKKPATRRPSSGRRPAGWRGPTSRGPGPAERNPTEGRLPLQGKPLPQGKPLLQGKPLPRGPPLLERPPTQLGGISNTVAPGPLIERVLLESKTQEKKTQEAKAKTRR
jgi:hypothetical protein